jgi:tetratricopeptide (TPR) repeat protein
MASLRPDTSSYARQSYLRELRGDIDGARTFMRQALDVAPSPSDRAFALFYLGELAFNSGDVNGALAQYRQALAASPTDIQALAGKAKAEAALGQHLTAIDDYTAEANGVEPDAAMTLFHVARGQAATALSNAERGITTRPFVAMRDAYAWALHANGRDNEALVEVQQALQLGTRSALTHYHAGMINLSLGRADAARTELSTALRINPSFDPLAAPVARQTLASLEVDA